jgi:hypothetical protein
MLFANIIPTKSEQGFCPFVQTPTDLFATGCSVSEKLNFVERARMPIIGLAFVRAKLKQNEIQNETNWLAYTINLPAW